VDDETRKCVEEFERHGLIERFIGPEGERRWRLTELGRKLSPHEVARLLNERARSRPN
jgi:hypothetical protein